MKLFLVAAPGLEETVAAETRALAGAATAVPGGVELDGDLETLYRLCLWLRVASRVLVRLGEVRARDFARLRRDAAALRWETVLGDGAPPAFAVTTHHCRLHHTGAIAERLLGAVEDRLGERGAAEPVRFVVRGEDDRFLISADASGELLHRRGYRQDAAPAPLRETLAAGVLALAGFTPETPLVDPTCGSGTFVIEAALIAAGRAPGARRPFAFQRWPGYRRDLFDGLAAAAERAVQPATAPLIGADIDAGAVAAARKNAERAGVAATFLHTDAGRLHLPDGPPGLVVANPPYGRRLEATRALYRTIGALARRRGWRLALITSDSALAALCGRPERVIALSNGGLRVGLHLFFRQGG